MYRRIVIRIPLILLLLLMPFEVAGQGKCDKAPKDYNGYQIEAIRFDTPLGWLFGSVGKEIEAVVTDPNMPVKIKTPFDKDAYNASFIFLKKRFPELTVSKTERIKVRIAQPGLADCDDAARTLTIVYHIYTFSSNYYLIRAFETGRKDELKRSVIDTTGTQELARYFPQPEVGYDRSRAIYAGSKVSIQQPGGLLNNINLAGSGSSSSAVGLAEATGVKDPSTGLVRHLEYQFRYSYLNLPGDQTKLKQGLGIGQFLASTRAFGSSELIFRFGGVVQGGNELADVAPNHIPTGNVANARVGSVRAFIGASMRIGKMAQPIKASYGLQLGKTGEGTHLDYVKHLVDAGSELRFPFGDHRAFTADLLVTFGSIHTRTELPFVERFFGGNAEQNFTMSPTWVIRSNPVIRSFSQNRFDRNSANGVRGGDRFFSSNITLGVTAWRKPLVPSEIVDENFDSQAEFGLNTAEQIIKNQYLTETPEFKEMAQQIDPLAKSIEAISVELNKVEGPTLSEEIKTQMAVVRSRIAAAKETADKIAKDLEKGDAQTGDIRKLVIGFPTPVLNIDSQVLTILKEVDKLIAMPGFPVSNLPQLRKALESAGNAMATSFKSLSKPASEDVSGRPKKPTPEEFAAARAKNDMRYPRRVFSQLVNEANIISINPVAIIDTARLWQRNVAAEKFRFGIGPGVRLTIVSLDITTGYAFNANRQPWEGRGALVFTMQASNLFR